jgi:hypothetical protein
VQSRLGFGDGHGISSVWGAGVQVRISPGAALLYLLWLQMCLSRHVQSLLPGCFSRALCAFASRAGGALHRPTSHNRDVGHPVISGAEDCLESDTFSVTFLLSARSVFGLVGRQRLRPFVVEREEAGEDFLLRQVRGPAVGGEDGCVEDAVGVCEPFGAGVVEVGEGALLQVGPPSLSSTPEYRIAPSS